jgi:hypothetical protein
MIQLVTYLRTALFWAITQLIILTDVSGESMGPIFEG